MSEFRGILVIVLFLSACASTSPIQVADPDISSLGSGFYDPRYIPNGCVYTVEKEVIKAC